MIARLKYVGPAVLVLALMAGIAWLAWSRWAAATPADHLFGNVEIRQVDLAFNSEGTVVTMAKHEGDPVTAGEIVAALDDATYRSVLTLTEARRDAAQAALTKLLNGSRVEDIDQARANLANARAAQANAKITYERQAALVTTNAVSRQAVDDARRALDGADAMEAQAAAALAEQVSGPRAEDIAVARAQLREAEASRALAEVQLGRATLRAPAPGIVMTRVIEPGTVVLPASPVYSMALTDEVWVRAFVPEPLLARAVPSAVVRVFTDGRPDQPYEGRIGYVSPTAEFTPKTVETPELRTQLVYRLRIRLTHPDDGIRQGQPVTIVLAPPS